MTVNDDWLTAAFSDTDLVAEVLLKLRTSPPPLSPPPPPSKRPTPAWTVHQRRSRTQPPLPTSNKSETPRASPSTPLSWSGGGGSGGGGGVTIVDGGDSTEPNRNRSDILRSNKVKPHGETTPTKRPKKKKTLAALKEEELLLMEEQTHLKRKLIALQSTCEKQRKNNENLKKMKLDIQQPNNQFEEVNERNDKFFLPDLNDPVGEDVIVS